MSQQRSLGSLSHGFTGMRRHSLSDPHSAGIFIPHRVSVTARGASETAAMRENEIRRRAGIAASIRSAFECRTYSPPSYPLHCASCTLFPALPKPDWLSCQLSSHPMLPRASEEAFQERSSTGMPSMLTPPPSQFEPLTTYIPPSPKCAPHSVATNHKY